MQEFKVENLKRKIRIDAFIGTVLPNITRSTSKKVVLEGIVKVNGNKIKPNAKIFNDDVVTIDVDEIRKFIDGSVAEGGSRMMEMVPVKMDLDIIFEDDNSIILNKQSGVVVHPSYMHNEDSLMNGLTYYVIHHDKNPFVRIRPVHRLDRDTSGIILFSKNLEAHNFYSSQFKHRDLEKTYLAVVQGDFLEYLNGRESIMLKSYIAKSPAGFVYKSTDSSKGDYAETQVYFEKHLGDENGYSLLKVIPHTGRTHQIRVHLSEAGFPIVGDSAYGSTEQKRLMLHAWRLKFKLLGNSEFSIFETKIPDEFKSLN